MTESADRKILDPALKQVSKMRSYLKGCSRADSLNCTYLTKEQYEAAVRVLGERPMHLGIRLLPMP